MGSESYSQLKIIRFCCLQGKPEQRQASVNCYVINRLLFCSKTFALWSRYLPILRVRHSSQRIEEKTKKAWAIKNSHTHTHVHGSVWNGISVGSFSQQSVCCALAILHDLQWIVIYFVAKKENTTKQSETMHWNFNNWIHFPNEERYKHQSIYVIWCIFVRFSLKINPWNAHYIYAKWYMTVELMSGNICMSAIFSVDKMLCQANR